MAVTLADWLGTRTPAQIASLLTARPDAVAPPEPGDLVELADRLELGSSVAEQVHRLPLAAIQVLEVLQLLGPDGGEHGTLATWLGRPADDPDLAGVLDLLTARALAWPDGDRWQMVRPLYGLFRHPLGLGAPAGAYLARLTVEQLRPIARTLGVPGHGRRQELVGRIATQLTDPTRVRALVAGADAATRAVLDRMAVEGRSPELVWSGGQYRAVPALSWAMERGLVIADSWGVPQLPREVALALRGPGWRAPFTPHRPVPRLVPADPVAVEREAAAAAGAAVDQVTSLLEAIDADPVSPLRTGGVGVKELRRLARTLGTGEDVTRLWLELAYQAGLLGMARHGGAARLVPTPGYDRWAATGPGERLAVLLPAWVDLPVGPLWHPGADRSDFDQSGADQPPVRPAPALVRDQGGRAAALVRRLLLRVLADLPAGQGATGPPPAVAGVPRARRDAGPAGRDAGPAGQDGDGAVVDGHAHGPAGLAGAVRWLAPVLLAGVQVDRLVAGVVREAELVGVVAHGALTPVGRSLVDPGAVPADERSAGRPQLPTGQVGPPELAAACRALLPAAATKAIFQADLTALVPGIPERELAELLDAVADRESRGGAATWRFRPGSVRRALDAGHQPDQLLAALRSRATTGQLPQPLRYLVTDLARKHGAVRVREVACVVRADDPALVAEIAGARELRALELSVITPTVLGSRASAAETLAALRAAGYAPVREGPDGTPVVERVPRYRAPETRRPGAAPAAPDPFTDPAFTDPTALPDPLALATALLAAPATGEADEGGGIPRGGTPRPTGPDPTAAGDRSVGPATPAVPAARAAGDGSSASAGGQDLAGRLAGLAGHLAPAERRLLAYAIETGKPVRIVYTNAQGNRTTRIIDEAELEGAHLVAWCQLREDERRFAVGRIDSVAPAR